MVVLPLGKVSARGLEMERRSGHGLGSQVRLQILVPSIWLETLHKWIHLETVRLVEYDIGYRSLEALVVFGRRRTLVAVAVAIVAYGWCFLVARM